MAHYIDLGTGVVHWKDYGGSGPLMVMVHGLGGSVANWDAIAPRLTDRARVTALDLPGFGLSPPSKDWSLETHRDAIAGFIEAMGEPAVLIGNSMGGLLSEMVASRYPDLVEALVLISPATPPRLPDPKIHWPMARRLLIGATPGIGPMVNRQIVSSMTSRELVNDLLHRITHKPGRVPLEMVESFVTVAETRSRLPWAADAVPKTGQSIRRLLVRRRRFIEMIRSIKAPTLVVTGIADPVVSPTSVAWICSLRLDWKLVLMEDTGHTPQIDAPIRFLSVVEPWLDAHLRHQIAH
ncbi:MAG TPA: alpha/beta hydrolase [Acidimicrobiia bacterium]|nr:alpha/beta hydrolase [Acidimicrobiia bacterium]